MIEPAIAQPIFGQRALRQVLGRGAGVVLLAVPAVMEMPVALELWAAWSVLQIMLDRLPGGLPMAFQVVGGYLVGDAAIAQHRDQPIEQRGRVVMADGGTDAFCSEGGARLGNEVGGARPLTDVSDQARGVIESLMPRLDRRDRLVVLRHL